MVDGDEPDGNQPSGDQVVGGEVGREVRAALGAELLAARRDRDPERVAVLRALLAAIDNAEAVAAPQSYDPARPGLGRTEVRRRGLDVATVQGLFAGELQERELAATQYRSLGQQDAADGLERECRVIEDVMKRLGELARPGPSA